jgi:tetratricopeptide (TPR) repeat protein
MSKLKLPKEIESAMIELTGQGRAAWAQGDVRAAEEAFIKAWDVLPEPKFDYDYAQSMASGLVTFFRDTRQFEKAENWLELTKPSYGADNPAMLWAGATLSYEAGKLDEAFGLFDRLHKAFGERPFQGYDQKYLKFFRERARMRN